jgi:hypothetical protein
MDSQTQASFAMWLLLNANPSSTTNQVNIFNQFTAPTGAGGAWQIEFWRTAGQLVTLRCAIRGGAVYAPSLTVLVPVHIAITYDGSNFKAYLNGTLVQTTASAGGSTGVQGNQVWRLGPDFTDLDITLDEPCLWLGYALTQTDVTNIFNRSVSPPLIQPSNMAWYLSCVGTALANVTLGDAGIQDGSGHSRNITTINGTPTYTGSHLTYMAPSRIREVRANGCGKMLSVLFETTPSGASLTNLHTINNASLPSYSKNGGAAVTLPNSTLSVYELDALPYIQYPLLSDSFAPGDTITFNLPGDALTTAAGGVSAVTNMAVVNNSGGEDLPAFVHNNKSMKVGWNINQLAWYSGMPFYANLRLQAGNWSQSGSNAFSLDSSGYPTDTPLPFPSGYCFATISGSSNNNPGARAGTWYLIYLTSDGGVASLYAPLSLGGTTTTCVQGTPTSTSPGGGVTRWKIPYTVGFDNTVENSPIINIKISTLHVSGVEVYDPAIADPDHPPLFHPDVVSHLAGTACIRFVDFLNVNFSNRRTLADFAPRSYWSAATNQGVPNGQFKQNVCGNLVSIQDYDNSGGPFEPPAGYGHAQVVTDVPHGLVEGLIVKFVGSGLVTLANSSTADITTESRGAVHVINATTFAFESSLFNVSPIAGVQTPGGIVRYDIQQQGYWQDCVALCNLVGCDLWYETDLMLSSTDARTIADYIAANLTAGKKCWIEHSNEIWNYAFAQARQAYLLAQADNTIPNGTYDKMQKWRAKDATRIHDQFVAAFAAVGRSADLKLIIAGQYGGTSDCGTQLDYAKTLGKRVDAYAIAPYWDAGDDQHSVWKSLVGPQASGWNDTHMVHDVARYWNMYGGWLQKFNSVFQAAIVRYPAILGIAYEGGPSSGLMGGSYDVVLSHYWARARYMYNLMLYFLQTMQGLNCSLYMGYQLAYQWSNNYATKDSNWNVYFAYNTADGTGVSPENDFSLRFPGGVPTENALDLQTVVSEVGGATRLWQSLTANPKEVVIRHGTETLVIQFFG